MLHVTVVIQVIMLKIRKRCDIKNNVINTVQTQRMRRDLNNGCTAIFFSSKRENTLNLRGLGSRLFRIDDEVTNTNLNSPAQCRIVKGTAQNGTKKVSCCGLSIRPSYGRRFECRGRMAVNIRRDSCARTTRIRNNNDWNICVQFTCAFRAFAICNNC